MVASFVVSEACTHRLWIGCMVLLWFWWIQLLSRYFRCGEHSWRDELKVEEPRLNMDHFRVHVRCWYSPWYSGKFLCREFLWVPEDRSLALGRVHAGFMRVRHSSRSRVSIASQSVWKCPEVLFALSSQPEPQQVCNVGATPRRED